MQDLFFHLPTVYSDKPTVTHISMSDTDRLAPWGLGADNIVSYHYHNYFEIGYCFEGNGIHYTQYGAFPFQPGDALFILPGHPHYTVSRENTTAKWMFLYFDLEEMLKSMFCQANLSESETLNPVLTLYELIPGSKYPVLCQKVLQITRQYQTFRKGRNELLCALFLELLFLISRETGTLPPCPIQSHKDYGKLNDIIQYIYSRINAGSIPKSEEIASKYFMSTSNFRKVFRETVGISPHDFVIQLAVKRAQILLLSSDMRILDICSEVGFLSVASLNRNFINQCGMSPQAYRQVHKSLY